MYLKGTTRSTTGNITWTSTSSTTVYNTATGTGVPSYDSNIVNKGELGLLWWLGQVVLVDYLINEAYEDVIKNSIVQYAADSGSTDSYTVTLPITPAAYFEGMRICFKANTANTDAATINVNGLGAKTIKDIHGYDLLSGALISGETYEAIYDGTYFILLNMPFGYVSSLGHGKSGITTSENLNSYVNVGTYICYSSTTAATLSNCPTTGAFKMYVNSLAGTSIIISQEIIDRNGNRFSRFSTTTGVSWTPWQSNNDGWLTANETWTYASASTFTISGDLTGKYQKGDKIKLTQTTTKYFYIGSVSYSAPNTTVTIVVNTDYTLANAAITNNYYSKIENPQGFPQWFNWTPTYTGFSSAPTATHKFMIANGNFYLLIAPSAYGTSNATNFQISFPTGITCEGVFGGRVSGHNNGTNIENAWAAVSSGNIDVRLSNAVTTWTGSGAKGAYLSGFYKLA